jgi:hypothetical protein
MGNPKPLLTSLFLFGTAVLFAQRANVSVAAEAASPHDVRPFGKYLVQICTLSVDSDSPETQQVSCAPICTPSADRQAAGCTPWPHASPDRSQSITLNLVCNPAAKGDCTLQYPLVAGSDFFVSATADSGGAVQQRVVSGRVTPLGGNRIVRYRAGDPGVIVIRASLGVSGSYAAAAPVDLILQVAAEKPADAGCALLGTAPAGPSPSKPIDLPGIITLLGSPTPFVMAAQGPNTILVYSTRTPLNEGERSILRSFQDSIDSLVGRTAASLGLTPAVTQPFSVELTIPHAAALGDLATRISALNYSQFTAQDVGSGRVRITAPNTPDCDTWTGFLSDIRRMQWQLVSEPLNEKLFYLSSSDVATAFSGLAGSASPTTTPAPAAGGSTPAPASSGGSTGSSNASVSVTQPPGSVVQINSDTTPCVIAGLTFGNAGACGPPPSAGASTPGAGSGAPGASAAAPAPKAPPGMQALASAMGAGVQTPPDLLVFSDTNPGDDSQIAERKRVLALLDLPRPEMVINAWVMQNSSTSARAMGAFSGTVKDLVAEYNDAFERLILQGWGEVKRQTEVPGYFNPAFYSYVADRFIVDALSEGTPGQSTQKLAQAFLDNSPARMADPVAPAKRTSFGICERGRYCLGYNTLFRPLKPRLTDLLLTLIAADNPIDATNSTIQAIEGTASSVNHESECDGQGPEVRDRCRAIWQNLDLDDASPPPQSPSCASEDYRRILSAPLHGEPRIQLRCFARAAQSLLTREGTGLARAAVADFLFNYKLSQQYPHEFGAYDLSQSADALNSALAPLVDAFNRDLAAFQMFVRADMQYRVERINARHDERCCIKRLFGLDKPSFFNDGMVTVRTISGQATTVNATSQSYLNASTAPELSALLNSVAGTTNANSGTSNPLLGAVLSANPVKRAELLAGALANYQTTYAQIGRSLQLSAIPRSLSTASSAEIAITLNADESAGVPTYSGGGQSDPAFNTSRVASHDTTTRVRIDSVKLFEVSSFSAIVERSKSRFPLLPPFVELPYIGTLAGIPLGAAKEFHSSTAVLSAMVVPTATDIAYGLRFVWDLVVDGEPGACSFVKGSSGADAPKPCLFRRALLLGDLNKEPIRTFNKAMVRCLATALPGAGCDKLSFDRVPREAF